MSPIFADSQEIEGSKDKTIFDYADSLKLRVPTSCGRTGECHECIVEIKRGESALSTPTENEKFLKKNYRLACQTYVTDIKEDVEFSTLRRQPKILTSSINRKIDLNPKVLKINDSVMRANTKIDKYRGRICGIAGDIGTTTVVLNLVDLETGETILTSSFENPQKFGGSDVMNRISYDGGQYNGELQQVMLSSINFEIGMMTKEAGIRRRQIYDAVFVGNTTMRDILFGIDVQPIGEKPYKSSIQTDYENGKIPTTSVTTNASNIGLRIFPEAHVYSGPLISSHIGSDISADLLAISMDEKDDPVMLVDIGTNTEVVIGNRHKMVTASCPAGPAFEGGEITYGMPGYDGAVESVKITSDNIPHTKTIGDKNILGICGSGLVDLLAELRRTEIMSQLGVLSNNADYFRFSEEEELDLYRSDISSLAQAKSANYSGQYIALRHYGKSIAEINMMFLAGGFANYIDVENAKNIGFIANFPTEKITKVGNSSLEGATIMLRSNDMRDRIESLVSNISHIELETTPDFFDIFVEGCMFQQMSYEIT
ncbi:MAG: ASKHA domain-containing protein [Dehalococcoidia bacterium]